MSGLRNVTIRAKLRIFALVLLCALSVVGLAGYRGVQHLDEQIQSTHLYFTVAQAMLQIATGHDEVRAITHRAILLSEQHDEAGDESLQNKLQEATGTVQAYLSEIATFPLSDEIKQALELVRPLLEAYVTKAQEIVTYTRNGHSQEARRLLEDFERLFYQFRSGLAQIDSMLRVEVTSIGTASEQTVAAAKRTIPSVLFPTLLIALVLGVFLARSITKPMRELTTAAAQIARGNVEQHVRYEGRDEIGDLATAFRELIYYFRTMADAADAICRGDLTVQVRARSEDDILSHSFLRMVGTLQHMSGHMQESMRILAGAIEKILASMQQLSTTIAKTATSVAETTTTVEEVKHTAHVSNLKAQEISESSHQTLETSQHGQHSVEEAIEGMTQVRNQMESITHCVAELGTQTQTAGNIIATVNTLAKQLHLLAVNAAIEAAKAGTAGKGFAVVAQEVRGLADQSKRATVEVQRILTDIRHAVDTTVYVTQQGTHSANLGAQRSLQAGESIRSLTQNITESAQAMLQIAASSQQQLVGMDQVAMAIGSIRQTSAQSASGFRDVEAAARNLQSVGHTLKALVEQFVLTTTEEQTPPLSNTNAKVG